MAIVQEGLQSPTEAKPPASCQLIPFHEKSDVDVGWVEERRRRRRLPEG
ncbi:MULTISPECIES: hypothetical protein [Nostoc]|uniref:Uncharacterized protein n=1 Tax=Nostoc paludosum FACHB-159 TaxID=2692908 RepID=A0ABR8KI04_9NOSO|nr:MULTISPECIES: hypothetical protein [Nostoc]MBD2681244.1 hypothetical protein [Nostoc sp. FACHB-857]MBD2737722.1 hypothetical protein [Nostoc paludosum FACHB-159]